VFTRYEYLQQRRTSSGSEKWPPGSLLVMGMMEENLQ
jgi:hypothetical protein